MSVDEDINAKYGIDSLFYIEGINNKIQLRNIDLKTTPVSEFYMASKNNIITLQPNKDLARNKNGAVLYSINEEKTLNEIIDEVYSEALSNYEEERKNHIK